MSESNGSTERMDRVERGLERLEEAVEKIADSQRNLLTAQVLFVDETRARLGELAGAQMHTDQNVGKLAAAHERTEQNLAEATDKLNALIGVVDGIVRGQPPAQG
jgi:division protein CdvB (Snf7/Vps24/ESCRT-III family)